MRAQALYAVGALCGLLTVVTAIPALKYDSIAQSCGVTTVYITAAPNSSTSTLAQLPNTLPVNYGGVSRSELATTNQPNASESSIIGLGSGQDSTSTAHLTSTVYQNVFLTRIMTGTGTTSTETIDVTYSTSSPIPTGHKPQTYATFIESMSSADIIMAPSSSMTLSQAIKTASDSFPYPVFTQISLRSCSGDLVTCPETSASNSVSSSSAAGVTSRPLAGSTSTPPDVYIIETLTVIPLAALPTPLSSTDQTATLNTQLTRISTSKAALIDLDSSSPLMTATIYVTGLSGTARFPSSDSSSSRSYLGWNVSISSSSVSMSSSSQSAIGSGISTTLVYEMLSSIAPTTLSYSAASINFSNSYLLPNVSSGLVAQSGFIASLTTSVSSTDVRSPSSWEYMRITTASPSPFPADEASWTVSCSEKSLATSNMDAGQSIVVSAAKSSSSNFSSTSYSSNLLFLNSATSRLEFPLNLTSSTAIFEASPTGIPSIISSLSASMTSLSSELGSSSYLRASSTATSELMLMDTSTMAASVFSNIASSVSEVADTFTKSIASASSTPLVSTQASLIHTFSTLKSSAPLSASSPSTSTASMPALSVEPASFTSSLKPKPTVCGEHGAFTFNFDDLPPLSVKDNTTADPMPLFSPYRQFYFSDGWTIVPPPTDPYKPSSGRLLTQLQPDPNSALGYTGALGNGENALLGCFNFNAIGMSLGCDSTGPDCDWEFTGLRYNNVTKDTDTITKQTMSTAACALLSNCDLVPVFLDKTFTNLTELRINVTVAGVDKIWWLDDLHLSWFDDSCNAGLCRQEHI